MRKIAVALGIALAAGAATASAQYYPRDPYHPDWVARERARDAWRYNPEYRDERWRDERWQRRDWRDSASWECWNFRRGHYEDVREGEFQDDLDYARCRTESGRFTGPHPQYGSRW